MFIFKKNTAGKILVAWGIQDGCSCLEWWAEPFDFNFRWFIKTFPFHFLGLVPKVRMKFISHIVSQAFESKRHPFSQERIYKGSGDGVHKNVSLSYVLRVLKYLILCHACSQRGVFPKSQELTPEKRCTGNLLPYPLLSLALERKSYLMLLFLLFHLPGRARPRK